jgi:UDP-4-keto-D-FucNAc 4-reductase
MTVATIAITGASGFIGRRFSAHVAANGHRPLPLSRGDLCSNLQLALRPADVVVHLAGRAHVLKEEAEDPAKAFHAANVGLTGQVLDAAIDAGVRRFVLMSSAGVLGNATSADGLDDDASPNPYDDYSRSKFEAEQLLRALPAGRIETVIVRPPLVYGPGARGNFGRILRAVRRGWPLPVGSLHAPRSMIGLRNLCDITLLASLDPRAAHEVLLVSDSQAVSVRQLALALAFALGKRPAVFGIPVPLLASILKLLGRRADVARLTAPFVVRPKRAGEVLKWSPPYSFAEEIEWTISESKGELAF